MAYPILNLLMMLLVMLVMLVIVSAVFMVVFNASVGYLSSAFNLGFSKEMGILPAMAMVVLLWIVGSLLFKSMETVVVSSCVPKEQVSA